MDDAWVDGHVAFLFSAADVGVVQFGERIKTWAEKGELVSHDVP